ncbi:MAG: alpha/beta hydrolase, partial [Pseudomonadota bacterium]
MTSAEHDVLIEPDGLPGLLCVPGAARGLVVFVHGSGSSRLSPRNRQVATALGDAGYGTLLFDLLHVHEAEDRRNVFDIPLLASRTVTAVDWLDRAAAARG